MAVISIPRILREKLGDEATDAFVNVVKEIDLDARKEALSIAEERFEKKLTELELRIEKRFTDMLKWRFIFWASQIGIIFAFLKFMIK